MIDIASTLVSIRPGEVWSLDGTEYDGLTWLDKTSKPTLAEIESAWPKVEQELKLAEQAKTSARDSAIAKLSKLGLTAAEISALLPE